MFNILVQNHSSCMYNEIRHKLTVTLETNIASDMAYWHRTLGNTKVQKKNLRLCQDPPPLPTPGSGQKPSQAKGQVALRPRLALLGPASSFRLELAHHYLWISNNTKTRTCPCHAAQWPIPHTHLEITVKESNPCCHRRDLIFCNTSQVASMMPSLSISRLTFCCSTLSEKKKNMLHSHEIQK